METVEYVVLTRKNTGTKINMALPQVYTLGAAVLWAESQFPGFVATFTRPTDFKRSTFTGLKKLIDEKNNNNEDMDLIVEKVGRKIMVYNNKSGIQSEYNNVNEAYVAVLYNEI